MPILFSLQGQSHGIRNSGIPAILLGIIPLPNPQLLITGTTKDASGTPIGGCTVTLYSTATNMPLETVVSDGNGYWSVATVGLSETYYIVAYQAGVYGSVGSAGVTANTLTGV